MANFEPKLVTAFKDGKCFVCGITWMQNDQIWWAMRGSIICKDIDCVYKQAGLPPPKRKPAKSESKMHDVTEVFL